jgi:AraC-like DNA-binding protein
MFESQQSMRGKRWVYNRRKFNEVFRTGKTVRGEHSGFHDLFVPLHDEKGKLSGACVAGPFAMSRPSSAEVLERWHALSGSQGHVTDPQFRQYLSATLKTLTLEGSLPDALETLVECFAGLISNRGEPELLARRAEAMRFKLGAARLAEAMWDAIRTMVDEPTSHVWAAPDQWRERSDLGLSGIPEHVVVGLLLGDPDEPDPVDDLLRRDAFQRACVVLARRQGDVVCGQVGDQGVVFLVTYSGSAPRTRQRLTDLAARASTTARRFGFKLRAGIHQANDDLTLPARYGSALLAAEIALSQGSAVVEGAPRPAQSLRELRRLRMRLGQGLVERPDQLAVRFAQYAEAVALHSGYRLEPIRAQLDGGVERIAEQLLAAGTLDPKSFDDMLAQIERQASSAQTVKALVELYRSLVTDIQSAIEAPTAARQLRSTRRAVAFMREHASEPLSLARVARSAGFAPDYFSRLFRRTEGTTFERYLQQIRVAKAKRMLLGTDVRLESVSRLCGFKNRAYFHRVFKALVGTTPSAYRQRGS